MARVVSVFLPSWPTDRLRRTLGGAGPPPEAPLVLTGRDGRRRVVLALDAAARRAGLHAAYPRPRRKPWYRGSSSGLRILPPTRKPSTGSLFGRCGGTRRSLPPTRRMGW